jgi:hypothetical protein
MLAAIMVGSATAIMVGSAASANQTASATTGFSAATLQHLLIAVLVGGRLLFGSGFSAASQSLVGPLPGIWLTATGVRWVNESLTQPVGPVRGFRAFESAPPRSLTGPAAPAPRTAVRSPDKAVSQPLLLDHAELAAAEEAQREAARARRGGRPIRRSGRAGAVEAHPPARTVTDLSE